MAKKSIVERNKKRKSMAAAQWTKREELRKARRNPESTLEDRVRISMRLAGMPRNGAKVRVRNGCVLTGRGRGV